MGRAPCCQKVGLKRGRWTAEEDQTLIKYIQDNGEGSWRSLPKNAGLLRCGKSCRLRWINYLRTDLKRGSISPQEEDLIIKLHATLGNRWSLIASQLSGRTDNEIKNHWNSHLRRSINTWRRPANDTLPQHILDNLAKMMAKPNSSTKKESKKNRAQAKKSESPNHVEIDVVVVGEDDDSKDNPQTPDACRETLLCRNSWSDQSVQSIFSPEDQPEAEEQGLEMGMNQLLMMPQHLFSNEIQKSPTVDFDLVNDLTDFSTSHAEMGSSWFPTCSTTLDTTTTKQPSPSPASASLHSFDQLMNMSSEWNWEDCVQTPDQDLMNLEVGSLMTCLWDGVNVAGSGS